MNLPDDITLPFFAYGYFKPGEISFHIIKDSVKYCQEWEIPGMLKERDGVPLLKIGSNTHSIKGALIFFKEGMEKESYQKISEIEPGKLYEWYKIKRLDQWAWVLKGTEFAIGPGSHDYDGCGNDNEWNGNEDPYFVDAISIVKMILADCDNEVSAAKGSEKKSLVTGPVERESENQRFFKLQMAYSLLWAIFERFAILKYGFPKDSKSRLIPVKNNISNDDHFKKLLHELHQGKPDEWETKKRPSVYISRIPQKKDGKTHYTLDPSDSEKTINYYYQIRSNLVHRGKSIHRDYELLKSALQELLMIFEKLFEISKEASIFNCKKKT